MSGSITEKIQQPSFNELKILKSLLNSLTLLFQECDCLLLVLGSKKLILLSKVLVVDKDPKQQK